VVSTAIREAIGPELEILASSPIDVAAAKRARKSILKRVSSALDGIEKRTDNRHHDSATTVHTVLSDGTEYAAMVPWLALQIARELTEKYCALPCKADVQSLLMERYPETRGLSEGKWTKVWSKGGLSKLPKGGSWRYAPVKEKARKTKLTKMP
jgi:hypothetical protein